MQVNLTEDDLRAIWRDLYTAEVDRAELRRRAEAAGVSPSELARTLLLEALDRGR